ncbi:hypothetical protein JMJ58_07375 [Haloterrigena salifodinae]|uniref:CHAT domain-containing protein n=1 Tax=Haloterrigena salifodinae TaxID=2675099 RepID=A0A8T8E519_9EURY|nr:hypothetical protein [Haloterrigena salifodinae]QRV16683.1 hypothetical protein JMJ58_07375 [Haloterrigena salifodinae]
MKPKFNATKDGLVIVDPIERRQCLLKTDFDLSPSPTATSKIPYSMDSAVEITTDGFSISSSNVVYVRDSDWTLIDEVRLNERLDLPKKEYIIDISTGIKLYVTAASKVRIQNEKKKTAIEFGRATPVTVSARSHHTSPATTITTTAAPTDIMDAISMFGSALKTIGPERSYPTLRGHPPTITVDNELDIPDELTLPDTGVRIEVPPTLRHVFVVAPLAYYLAAKVVPGSSPRLVTDSGFSFSLESNDEFDTMISRVIQHIFLLDCIVRTEGTTPIQLYERQELESVLEFNIEEIYGQPLENQLKAYLSTPFAKVAPYIPVWRLETELKTIPEHVELLPFAVADLGMISVENEASAPTQTAFQGMDTNTIDESEPVTASQSWHDGHTEITSTILLSAFDNGLDQTPRDGPLEIVVVCNDQAMRDELVTAYSTYGNRDDLPFDITVFQDLTTTELENVLSRKSDFLHYIGHIDSDGFRCSNGQLDAANVEKVGAKAFLLNACQSHDQGLQLIEAGSISGIVTLETVANKEAVRIGRTISTLLNYGYSLYAALDITRMETDFGNQYQIVGDGKRTITQPETGLWSIYSVDTDNERTTVSIKSYSGDREQKGSLFIPYLDSVDEYYISPNQIGPISVEKPQLVKFINSGRFPVLLNGQFQWSDEIKLSDLH